MQHEIDKTDARQGRTGMNVRYVLIWGLVLVVIAFAAVALLTR